MMKLDDIQIEEADAKALRDLNTARIANDAFVDQVRVAGERRNGELLQQGQALWTSLAKKYNLSLETIQYAPAPDGSNALKIIGARFL